jgi:hypothetical protein
MWRESWGDHGYGWFPYVYFLTRYNGDTLADDAWAITREEWIDTGQIFRDIFFLTLIFHLLFDIIFYLSSKVRGAGLRFSTAKCNMIYIH